MYISHMIVGGFFYLEKEILLGYIYQRYAKVQNRTEIPKTVFVYNLFWQFTSCVSHYSLKYIVHLCYCSTKIFEIFLLLHNKFGRSLYIGQSITYQMSITVKMTIYRI